MKKGWHRYGLVLLALAALRPAYGDIHFRHFEEDDEPKWLEGEVKLPDFPKDENLLEFYVSAGTTNRFFIDGRSISGGDADGVVRFTMVVKTAGGATNISHEGIRCATSETRLYATGIDGAWVQARNGSWKRIENKPVNRHHAALSRDYFCPNYLPIRTTDEGRDALRRGKHPDAK